MVGGLRKSHARNNRIILLSILCFPSPPPLLLTLLLHFVKTSLTDDYITIHKMDASTLSFLTKNAILRHKIWRFAILLQG